MPRIKLTHRGIATLAPTGKWLTDFMDEALPGFGVRAHHTGRKVFFVRYDVEGKRRRLSLGPYPALSLADARDKAKEALGRIAAGEDPQGEKNQRKQAETFDELADEYIERHAKVKKRRWREDRRIIDVDLLPLWKGRKAADIDRRAVTLVLDAIVERGAPIMANRTRALVSKIFNFGIGRGIVEHNPCHGVPQPAKAKQRDRVLSEDEIRRVWRAAESLRLVMGATFKMRLLTAQRGVEVLAMRWDEIDGDWWTIPAEVAKNGLSHRVPISPPARALLDELHPTTGETEWVFASWMKKGTPIHSVRKGAVQICEESAVDFVPHDLRRTAASHMTSMGISRLVVSKILNHVESHITAVYDRHSYDAEKREALDAWGARLDEILLQLERSGSAP